LFEFRNVLDVAYGAYVVNGAYGGLGVSGSDTTQAPSRDQAVAVIRELLTGETAAIRQSASDASTAVSTIQIFTDAIETISDKLAKMSELTKKSLGPDYSQFQVEEMQKQFRNLAHEINQTVNVTEYQINRPSPAAARPCQFPSATARRSISLHGTFALTLKIPISQRILKTPYRRSTKQ